MANLDELFSALQKADAAGNTEDAKQIANIIQQQGGFIAAQLPKPKKGLGAALERGTRGLLGSLQTSFESLSTDPNAAENAALKGLQRQQKLAEEIEAPADFERVKEAYKRGLLPAIGEVVKQVPGAIAEQVPQMGTMFAGARLGAAAGSVAGPGGALFGGIVGAAIPALVQFYGSNLERQAAEQINSGNPVDVSRGKAALAAAPQAALDMVQQRLLFGSKLFSKALGVSETELAKMSARKVEQLAAEKLIPTLAKGTVKGAAAEIPTEIGQQILERAQAGLSITSPDALAEYGNTAYQVGLLGPLGAVGRFSEKGQARAQLAGQEAADAAILADQQKQAQPPLPAGQMAPVTPGAPIPTQPATVPTLFDKAELPPQLTPDEVAGVTAKGKPVVAEALPLEQQKISELERNIEALVQQGTPEALAQAEALKQQLPETPQAKVFRLGEEMMQLERKYKELEAQRDETKALKDKEPLSIQMNQIRERQTEILDEGEVLKSQGVDFSPAEGLFQVEGKRKPQVAEQAELLLEPSAVVDEATLDTFGVTKAAPIRKKLLGLDMTKPEDREVFKDEVDKHTIKKAKIDMPAVDQYFSYFEEAPSEPGPVSDVGARAGQPSVSMPSGEFRPTPGLEASAATGLAGAQPDVGGPIAGAGASRKAGPASVVRPELLGKSTIDLADRITQGDLKGALQDIATSKQYSPLDNLVAKRLLQAKSLPKVEVVPAESIEGSAQYDPNTDTVQIAEGQIDSHTVLHETVHGFLHAMIRTSQARQAKGLGGNPKLKNLEDIYKHVQKTRPDLTEKYGMSDLSEFASEAMSNPDFQNDLRNTPYKKSNVFTEFGRAVLRLLGINLDQSRIADIDSLTAALMAAEGALSTGRKTQEDVQGGVRQQTELDVARQDKSNFDKWFGDSKVFNRDGSPMVVYHGTPKFEGGEFKPTKSINRDGNVAGYYFSPDLDDANHYAYGDEGAQILPVYLSIKNPYVIGQSKVTPEMREQYFKEMKEYNAWMSDEKFNGWVGSKLEYLDRTGIPYEDAIGGSGEAFQRIIKAGGYDGYKDGRHWVAFEPTQIKSVYNKGTFDPNVADIAYLKRTPAGKDAEADMAAFGGKAEAKQQSFVERQKAKFEKAKDEWQSNYEQNNSWVASTFGKGQNIASFDQAFNNRLYNHFMDLKKKGDITLDQAKQAILRISTSQALHRGNLANQIIDRGNYNYDELTNRWIAVDDDVNMTKFEDIIRSLATKLGVEPTRAKQIMGAAYEANRLDSMFKDLAKAKTELATAEADIKKLKDPKLKATKRKLIDALKEEVESLEAKVQHKTPEQVEAGMRLYNSHPEIAEGTKIWNTMRKRVVDLLVETGVKTEKQAEAWLDEAAYVPFFRDMEEERATGPQVMARGIRESMKDYRMKGSQREVADTIDNMYQWMQWSIARGISNKQLQVMVDSYKNALPDEVKEGKGPNSFIVYREGVPRSYSVADPAIAQAFSGIEPIAFPALKHFASTSNFLRHAVTRIPVFPIVQLFNDSYNAMFVSGLKSPFQLLKEIAKETVATAKGTSETREMLKKSGILETHDYNALTEADAIGHRLNLDKPGAWTKLMSQLDRFSSASDNIIRQGIYNQARKEGLSHEEAMEKAAEVVNFRRISGNETMQAMGRIVPFFNAYTQVASVAVKTLTGRGISPQERDVAAKVLIATTAKIMTLSMLYSMMIGDDEDYLKKNRVSRDRMFMIPGTGGAGIPIRMDIFAIPKLAGEYGYQLMTDASFTDPKMAREAIARAIKGSIAPPSEGVPQLVRPALGVMMNYDAFQDREIINATMRRLDPERQYTKNTSEMAKALGAMTGISPLNIDFLLRGYLGSVATIGALATNDVINAARGGAPRPDKSVGDILASLPNMGAFISREENTAVLTDFYEVARDINKANATFASLKNAPREEREAYRAEHKAEIALKGQVQSINNQLVMLKRREQMIREAPESRMSSERKQEELRKIDAQRSRMMNNVMRIRQKLYG